MQLKSIKYSRETTIELREALNGMAEKEDEICIDTQPAFSRNRVFEMAFRTYFR